jgi:transcriptional regulator
MYEPAAFRVAETSELVAFARAFPLGLLIATGEDGPSADLIPFLIDNEGAVLRAHVARPNPLVARLAEPQHVLVAFGGPNAYVSPGHYPSKREHGRVVPTWNYAMVQARGLARLREETDWLARQLDDLTSLREQGRANAWALADAPGDYVAAQMRGIVGLEIEIADLRGKYKLSQNRSQADRQGVLQGLALEEGRAAQEMAQFMSEKIG